METLLPKSIQTEQTIAIDLNFSERLNGLNIEQLKIDLENESDAQKIGLWLEQYGIPREIIKADLGAVSYRNLLKNVLAIYKASGTVKSIRLLVESLGGTFERLEYNYQLKHNAQARYDGSHKYDIGKQYKRYSIDVVVSGITRIQDFELNFRKLFANFQPLRIHLNKVVFS